MNKTLWQHVVISQSLSHHWSSCSKNKVEPKLQSRRVVCLSSLQPLLLHHCFLTILHLETETHYCSTLHNSLCVYAFVHIRRLNALHLAAYYGFGWEQSVDNILKTCQFLAGEKKKKKTDLVCITHADTYTSVSSWSMFWCIVLQIIANVSVCLCIWGFGALEEHSSPWEEEWELYFTHWISLCLLLTSCQAYWIRISMLLFFCCVFFLNEMLSGVLM